jgi:tryptophan-rich sensory protein
MRTSTLIATTAAVVATSTLGGLATRPAIQSVWYRQLRKPPYQSPRAVFPVVWPARYLDIAVASGSPVDKLRDARDGRAARADLGALGLNLVLDAGWVFFNRRRLAAAVALNAALTASSADLARRAIAVRGTRAVPLVLYPAWCAFAFVLSTHIWLLNRHRRIDVR